MNPDHAFLAAIVSAPDDRYVRSVYADWLDERSDLRGEYLRLQLEPGQPARVDELRRVLDPDWLAVVDTFGPMFRPMGLENSSEELPFRVPFGNRGGLLLFDVPFTVSASQLPHFAADLRELRDEALGECYYGATDFPIQPVMVPIRHGDTIPTAAQVLEALQARHFQSDHIGDLNRTRIPYPGYHPHTNNDEIHTDEASQYLFGHTDVENEYDEVHAPRTTHAFLKSKVVEQQLWYVLLHPEKQDGFAEIVYLFAVGKSLRGDWLVGGFTNQICHNLCD